MKFTVKEGFDYQGFLNSCRIAGVKLNKETPEELVSGSIVAVGGALEVLLTIDTPEVQAIITAKVAEYNA